MTQKDKELLLKDLSARLPYGVKAVLTQTNCRDSVNKVSEKDLYSFRTGRPLEEDYGQHDYYRVVVTDIKPYLFPLSSMTDEMLEELNANGFFKYRDTIANVSHLESKSGINEEIYTYIDIECISFLIKYFHSNHIDYKGFIETGLAIDATGKNIY